MVALGFGERLLVGKPWVLVSEDGGVVRLAGEGFDDAVLRRLKAGFWGWAKWLFSVRRRMERV